MKLEYSVALDDLDALYDYHFRHSPHIRRTMLKGMLVRALPAFVLLAVLGVLTENWIFVVAGVLCGGLSAALWPRQYRKLFRRHAMQCAEEGGTKGVIGPHQLEITDAGLSGAVGSQASSAPSISARQVCR